MRQVHSDAVGPKLGDNKFRHLNIDSLSGKNGKGIYWQATR